MRYLMPVILGLLLGSLLAMTAAANPLLRRDDPDVYRLYQADYHWSEIEDIGQVVNDLEDNSYSGPFDIGFQFPYFGNLYDQFYIGSNGFIGFGPTQDYASAFYQQFPDQNTPNNLIAVYWKNLTPSTFWGSGQVFYGVRDGNLVVEFQNYPEVNVDGHFPENTISMEIVLKPDGNILLQYANVGQGFDLAHGSIGLENEDGSAGLNARFDGQGAAVATGDALLISDHGPGNFLVWDGGSTTTSGDAEESALQNAGHTVTHLHLRLNQPLPNDLRAYEGVFVNLGNYGNDGHGYHQLTAAEGRILAGYLDAGGALYLEGSDFWTSDPRTDVLSYFNIEGAADGGAAQAPITGLDGGFAQGMRFDSYQDNDNNFVDHLRTVGDAVPVLNFRDARQTAIGMASYLGQTYRTVGASFEFGGLVDGDAGTKADLMQRMVAFFRSPPPQFTMPTNLRAVSGDAQVTLSWDFPARGGRDGDQRLNFLHQIAALIPKHGKPSQEARAQITGLKRQLAALAAQDQPRRDDMVGFNIYVDGQQFDFTNSRTYTAIELENGREYQFTVTAVFQNPDGESDPAGPVTAIPTESWQPPQAFDFERFNGALVAFPAQGGWEWGQPAVGAASGQNAWGTVLNGGYPNDANLILSTPTIDLSRVRQAWLTFNQYYDCEAGWDGGRLEVSTDNGQRWDVLTPAGGYPDQGVFALDEGPGYSGSSDGWVPATCDLTAYAGQLLLVRFVFKSDDSNFRPYPGWFIDDLKLFVPELGYVTVRVLKVADGTALPGARVTLNNQFSGLSDNQGNAVFSLIPAGHYVVTAEKRGYIPDSSAIDLAADQNLTPRILLAVYDSQLSVDPQAIEEDLQSGETLVDTLTLTNDGESPTDYQIYIDYFMDNQRMAEGGPLGGQPINVPRRDQPWNLLRTINLSQAIGDQYLICAEMVRPARTLPDSYKFVIGGGDFVAGTCQFYSMNRDGIVTGQVQQSVGNDISGWGVRDLTYDGTNLYGGDDNRLYSFDPVTGHELGNLFSAPLQTIHAVAYVPEDDAFWVGDRDDSWFKISRHGQILDHYSNHGLHGVVGMAWNPSDPDGAYLYVHNQESDNGGAALYRFNPRTRQLVRQMTTATEEEGTAGGAFTTYLYDTQTWVLGVVIQGPTGDVLKLYELWPHHSWVSVIPSKGRIEPHGEQKFALTFDARGLVHSDWEAVAEFHDLNQDRNSPNYLFPVGVIFHVEGDSSTVSGSVSLDDEGIVQDVMLRLNGRFVTYPNDNNDYAFDNLMPGRYQLAATLDGFVPFVSDSFDLVAGQNKVINIQLSHLPSGVITGRVHTVYGDENWLAGVEVGVTSEGGDSFFAVDTTDSAGVYSVTVPAGQYTVTPRKFGWIGDAQAGQEVQDHGQLNIDFIMDDHLPVHALTADGNWDDRVKLDWAPPGVVADTMRMQDDNGQIANGVYLRGRDDVVATRYEPEGTYDILSMTIYLLHRGDLGNAIAWPDANSDPIFLQIYAEDPDTQLPGELLWEQYIDSHVRLGNNFNGIITVHPQGLRFLRGAFYVGWHQNTSQNAVVTRYDAIALDDHYDHPGSTFLRIAGDWNAFDGLPGDQYLRATVLQYSEAHGRDVALQSSPRKLRNVANNSMPQDVQLLSLTPLPSQVAPIESSLSSFVGLLPQPRRDELGGYTVFVDGEAAAQVANDVRHWEHVVGSNGENHQHNYMVRANFQDGANRDGPEVAAQANLAPGPVTNVAVLNRGATFTINWRLPLLNSGGKGACIDYAGTNIYLNGELAATVNYPDSTFSGQIAAGNEGWYGLRLVGFDEVPNYSTPVDTSVALGVGIVYTFETNQSVFTASPGGSWLRDLLATYAPRGGHNHSAYGWRTRLTQAQYDNNAEWMLTTTASYYIASPSARLEFYQFYSTEEGHDGCQLLASVDGGGWTLLRPAGDYPDQTVAALENGPGWTGTTGAWTFVSVDLSQFQGHMVKIRWRFASDESINWYPGWYLDDVVFWGASLPIYAQIYGNVRDQNAQAVLGASVTAGGATAQSAQGGFYRILNLLPGHVTVTAAKAGYAPISHDINLNGRDSLRVDMDIYAPVVSVDPAQLNPALGGNDHLDAQFSLTNAGAVALPYNLRLLAVQPDRDRAQRQLRSILTSQTVRRDDPGDVQFSYNATTVTGQQRIMGAEYAADQFFLTSADPGHGLLVSVLTRDGTFVRSFQQPQAVPVGWGLRDLAWDGTLLYGSQNSSIYGFTTQGALQSTQQGAPLTVNRALAWDPPSNGFWAAEWDSPWYLVDRQGQVVFSWNGHGLTGVYGFAYHPADPDGMFLYALNLEDDGSTGVYRADPRGGQIERVASLDGAPTGCFITGHWDADRWILGAINGTGSQRLTGIELGRRISWISLDPTDGELDPGAEQDIAVRISVPPDAHQGDNYSGNISIQAFGGQQAAVHVSLQILDGFRHFSEPVVTDNLMTVHVQNASVYGRGPAVGSEIAVLTPQGRVGGVARWVQAPAEITVYAGDQGFTPGDSLHLVIWDAAYNQELSPTVEYVQGDPIFVTDSDDIVRLTVTRPDSQEVALAQGWNLISSYVDPFNSNIPTIFDALNRANRILLVKDADGNFWAPHFNFINMGPWNPLAGYQVYVTQEDSVLLTGLRLPEDTPISLLAGWNMVGYLFDREIDARVGLSGIMDHLIIAKNGNGDFMAPGFNYFGLDVLRPGEGYKIKVDQQIDLIYNPGNRLAFNQHNHPSSDQILPSTGSDMSILVTDVPEEDVGNGSELVAYAGNRGRIVGRAELEGLPAGIAIRGDDSLTAQQDGAWLGEPLTIAIVRDEKIIASSRSAYDHLTFETDGFAVVSLSDTREPLPTQLTLDRAFPNPFNGRTTIRYGLPAAADVKLSVMDIGGRVIWDTGSIAASAGWHEVGLQADNWSSGVYWVRVAASGHAQAQKIVLMR